MNLWTSIGFWYDLKPQIYKNKTEHLKPQIYENKTGQKKHCLLAFILFSEFALNCQQSRHFTYKQMVQNSVGFSHIWWTHASSLFTWAWKILKWLPGLYSVRHLEYIAASKLPRRGDSGTQLQFWGLGHFWLGLLHLFTPEDMFTSDPETSAMSNYKKGNWIVAFFFRLTVIFIFYWKEF